MSGMPRYIYEEEHEMFRNSVRKFLETEAAPYHAQWEKDGHVDRQLWTKAGEQGFLSPTVAEEYGGVGADFRYNAIVDEGCWGLLYAEEVFTELEYGQRLTGYVKQQRSDGKLDLALQPPGYARVAAIEGG